MRAARLVVVVLVVGVSGAGACGSSDAKSVSEPCATKEDGRCVEDTASSGATAVGPATGGGGGGGGGGGPGGGMSQGGGAAQGGGAPGTCGDGVCDAATETCFGCGLDCGVCSGSGEAHGYYDTLKTFPEVYPVEACADTVPGDRGACSLRDQAQLDGLTGDDGANADPQGFVYVVGADPYATPKDGAMLRMVPQQSSIGTGQQLDVTFQPPVSEGTLTFVWDAWFGPEWTDESCGGNAGAARTFKHFQVRAGSIYFETRARFLAARTCDDAFVIDNRLYGGPDTVTAESVVAPSSFGVVKNAPATPTGSGAEPPESYPIKHSRWTRYIEHVRVGIPATDPVFDAWREDCGGDQAACATLAEGTWNALYVWICDEDRPCTPILHGIPWHTVNQQNGNPRHVSEMNFEYNTSQEPDARSGDLVSYHRNLVVLRDYDLALDGTDWVFQQPVP